MKNQSMRKLAGNLVLLFIFLACGYALFNPQRLLHVLGPGHGHLADLYLETYELGLAQHGRFLEWPALAAINGEEKLGQAPQEMGVVLYLDDQGCSVCADDQTAFLRELAERGVKVRVVVNADRPAYVRSYVRVNDLGHVPVYYDEKNAFARANDLHHTPTLLVHNERSEVIAAHIPAVSIEAMTTTFHRAVWRLAREYSPSFMDPDDEDLISPGL